MISHAYMELVSCYQGHVVESCTLHYSELWTEVVKLGAEGAEGGDKSVGECDGQYIPGANVHVMGLTEASHIHTLLGG